MGTTPLRRCSSRRCASETERVQTIALGDGLEPRPEHSPALRPPLRAQGPYTFFDRRETTPENVFRGEHREVLHKRLKEEPGVYLLLEDGSEISFSGKKPIEGVGFIGNGQEGLQEGFLLHSVLAVVRWVGEDVPSKEKRPPVEVLGLTSQSYRVRHEKHAPQGKETSTQRKKRARESEDWLTSGAVLGEAPRENPAIRWVRVADRGADISTNFSGIARRGAMASWCARRKTAQGSFTPKKRVSRRVGSSWREREGLLL